MRLKLGFLIAIVIVSAIFIPAVQAQANLTFSGGNGNPLSITLQQSITYTVTNSNCSTGPIFIFDEAGNPFSGSGPLVSGTISFSIDGGAAQFITNSNSGVNAGNATPNDIFIYGNLNNNLSIGSKVVLSAGTVTTTGNDAANPPTTGNVAANPPANGTFPTFITNSSGIQCGAVLPPTAAPASISGRVLTSSGSGLGKALVYLTDSEGNTRISRTNPFGYYRFEDVMAGQTVMLTVVSKRYQFTPKVINLGEEATGVDFVGEQ